MPFYFAWCGDVPIPPFTLQILGDVWSGSWKTTGSTWSGQYTTNGDIFGTGVYTAGGTNITNLRQPEPLRVGYTYGVTSGGVSGDFFYEGDGNGSLHPPTQNPVEDASFLFTNDGLTTEIVLDDVSFLDVGVEYGIQGSGIPTGATFVFNGTNIADIGVPCTASAVDVDITITNPDGKDILKNLSDNTGLVVGETYSAFGLGLENNVLATYQSDGTLLLSQAASATWKQTFIYLHRGTIYPDGGPFDPDVHARKDEFLLSVELEHNEGHFPSLKIGIKNPRIGLLAPSRNVWCWLSWRRVVTDPIIPLFHGRLTTVPSDLLQNRITISFVAEPNDYEQQRNLLTEALKQPPNYDPIWFDGGNGTPDTILEGYTRDWHTSRTDLIVSTSDILNGEDGTLVVNIGEHISSDFDIQIDQKSGTSTYMTATAKFPQRAVGTVDITRPIFDAFEDAGSGGYGYPHVASYSADGLLLDWPKPGVVLNGGWKFGADTEASSASNYYQTRYSIKNFNSQMPTGSFSFANTFGSFANPWQYWQAIYPINVLSIKVTADYEADRQWQERVSFFVEADIQAMSTDGSVEVFSMNTEILDQPIDFDGLPPIKDFRSDTFFKTARGGQAFEFLLYYLIAKLSFKARAVSITFTTRFDTIAQAMLSCRWNATINDPRIPGGVATGKVIGYKLLASASGGMRGIVTIGCCIGLGGDPTAPIEGVGKYAAPGYMAPGYQTMTGATIAIAGGELTYQSFDDFRINDDGINFFNLDDKEAVKSVRVVAGPAEQLVQITAIKNETTNPNGLPGIAPPIINAQPQPAPDPTGALKNAYTKVLLEMNPVDGSGFETDYVITISKLKLPKTIDLEAPSA